MINLDKTLIIQMINFLILLLILNRLFYKPILGILEKRKNHIRQSEETVEELETRASEQWEAYERQLQEAKIEANLERERIKGEGLETQKKLLEEVRADASRATEDARKRIEEETSKARDLLRDQVKGVASEMAEKILGRRLQ